MRGFASDNYSGAHPEVLAALVAANDDHARAYGADDATLQQRTCSARQAQRLSLSSTPVRKRMAPRTMMPRCT